MTGERKSALEDLIRASVLADKLIAARAELKRQICQRGGEAFYAAALANHKEGIALFAAKAKLDRSDAARRLFSGFLSEGDHLGVLLVTAAWLEMIEDGYVEKTMKAIEEQDA